MLVEGDNPGSNRPKSAAGSCRLCSPELGKAAEAAVLGHRFMLLHRHLLDGGKIRGRQTFDSAHVEHIIR
ncbi:unnamed protein product [Pleuronectes platessa]|uniref:Uncharacterized protein n=1 Tax=Pleuronectes platessa TaxID=8262 RepID=A0A9N7YIW5_PLEPL|nr:unnamed protein product [Pleuronectes platessa]